MANSMHVEKLRDGARAWNAWRAQHPGVVPDLSGLDLSVGLRQFGPTQGGPIDLSAADLNGAALEQATLIEAKMAGASLVGADLSHARLESADLSSADLRGADLGQADLRGARLDEANLRGALLRDARNLTQGQIERAAGDDTTVLPAGLAPPSAWLAAFSPVAKLGKRAGAARVTAGDPHAILGVPRRASTREIRAAYLRLVKELHPDWRARDPAPDADEQLKLINDAYQELKGFGPRASARRAQRRSHARRASAIFLAGILTSTAPVFVVLVAGGYYAGWFGVPETETRTAAVPDEKRAPAGTGTMSVHPKDASGGREAAWTEAHKLGTRAAWERFIEAYPDGERAGEARQALAAIERAETRQREERAAWAVAQTAGTKEELQRFVEAYPDGEHTGQARQALAAIGRAEALLREEAVAWAETQRSGAKARLQRFLKDYPAGAHAPEARQALAAIEQTEARQREERAAWAAAEKAGTREELERFVAAYPGGDHAELAREALLALAATEARREADRVAWAAADASGAKAALQQYLADFPNGGFVSEAKERVALLEAEERERDDAAWRKAERRRSKAAYAGYLTTHPNGLRATDARLRIAELERVEARPPAEPAKAPAGRPRVPEAVQRQRWPAADEPFIGADGRIRR